MTELNIAQADYTDMSNQLDDYSVSQQDTDGATGNKETHYQIENWPKNFGYYKKIPELRSAIDARARWIVGKGYKTDEDTTNFLFRIRGFGKDSFNAILENQVRTFDIAGDSFAEIIKKSWLTRAVNQIRKAITREDLLMVNLKPLDPSTIKIVANSKGVIIRYEQVTKAKGQKNKIFKPEQIFHLSRNRTADEVHGISLIESVEDIILMRNEAMKDMKTLMHRYVVPRFIIHADTDNPTKIADIKSKFDNSVKYAENIIVPKDVVTPELMAVPTNATMNPLPWIDRLNSYFFQAIGAPQIIVGGSQEMTEATAKIAYLSWEQTVSEGQLYIEEQCGLQLGITLDLEMPASLQNEMLSDQSKSETMQAKTQEDTSVKGMPLTPEKIKNGGEE